MVISSGFKGGFSGGFGGVKFGVLPRYSLNGLANNRDFTKLK